MIPALLVFLFPWQQPPTDAPKDLCEVRVETRAEVARLFALASDADDHDSAADGVVRVYADRAEQDRLRRAGFDLVVRQPDLGRFYADRAASAPPSLTLGGSMGGFKTLAEIGAEMDRLAVAYPTIVSPKYSIGTSLEGRPIWALRVSDNPLVDEPGEPVAWFDAIHHAREPMSGEALLLLADWICTHYPSVPDVRRMVETRNIVFVPCVNPDGYEYNRTTNPGGGGLWRKNRRINGDGTFGVDLNRNYGWEWGPLHPGSSGVTSDQTYRGPSAFSEPETRAMRDALALHPPGTAATVHTYSDLWLYAWGYDTVLSIDDARFRSYGELMTALNGYAFGTPWQVLYIANGTTLDWGYGQHGTYCFSPEIGSSTDGFWPAPARIPALFEEVRPGLLGVIRWAAGWADLGGVTWQQVSGDGDAYLEPGERWILLLDLKNGGVDPVSGSLTLTSASSDISVVHSIQSFSLPAFRFPATLPAAPAGPHVPATPIAVPLEVEFAPAAQIGALYTLDLAISFDGLTTPAAITLRLGAPRVLAFDDMESSSFGWNVNNALNYSWQRAVPQLTTSGGQTAQPGNDDPAGAGTQCWVTGAAAGSSATTNDLDGITVLTSPRFHASGFTHLELEYARWFANLPGGPLDDHLLVEASSDDGASWTQLENSANDNTWRTVRFDLESFLPLTNRMRLRLTAADSPNNDLTEACLDGLVLRTTSSLPTVGLWGATIPGSIARLHVDGPPSASFEVRTSTTVGAGTSVPGIQGLSYLSGSVTTLASGSAAATGRATTNWTVPAGASVRYIQVLHDASGPSASWSNLLTVETP